MLIWLVGNLRWQLLTKVELQSDFPGPLDQVEGEVLTMVGGPKSEDLRCTSFDVLLFASCVVDHSRLDLVQ